MQKPMVKIFQWILPLTILCPLIPTSCLAPEAEIKIDDRALAEYWAPIWYQDTNSNDYTIDCITSFDYDGDWDGTNNWENQTSHPLKAYLYYWVIETETNWFIGYASLYPRNQHQLLGAYQSYENDMTGLVLTIRKDGSETGQFLAMVTWNRPHFYTYIDYDKKPSNKITAGNQVISGDVQFDGSHPYVYVGAEQHGVYGDRRWEERGFPGNDGIVYTYMGIPEEPGEADTAGGIVGYDLKSIGELWERRYPETYPDIFDRFGVFRGDITEGITMEENTGKAPWAWDDDQDFPVVIMQDFFLHPYFFMDYYCDGLGDNFSQNYVHRSYVKSEPVAIIVTVDGLSYGNTFFDPFDRNPVIRTNYMEISFQTMDHGPDEWDVVPFRWDGDAKYSTELILELRTFLRDQYNRASSQGKEFVVVSHSWGTVLTHVALSNEATGNDPIICDLYITLGDALAALYNREQPLPPVVLSALRRIVLPYLNRLGFDHEVSPPPKADNHINYWAWQDAVSGPLSTADQNVQIDPGFNPAALEGLSLTEIADLTSIWHGYQSLHLDHAPDNIPIRDNARDWVKQTTGR